LIFTLCMQESAIRAKLDSCLVTDAEIEEAFEMVKQKMREEEEQSSEEEDDEDKDSEDSDGKREGSRDPVKAAVSSKEP